jgi:hypothetical protein
MVGRGGEAYDAGIAAAEARLDRVDDELAHREREVIDEPPNDGVDADGFGFHVDDPDVDLMADDLDIGLRDDQEADAIDALAEPFNARDVEGLLAVIARDAEVPGLASADLSDLPDAVQDLWRRRPTCLLTRGYVEREQGSPRVEVLAPPGWWSTIAEVDCSGWSMNSSVSSTSISRGSMSLNSSAWSSRSGQAA